MRQYWLRWTVRSCAIVYFSHLEGHTKEKCSPEGLNGRNPFLVAGRHFLRLTGASEPTWHGLLFSTQIAPKLPQPPNPFSPHPLEKWLNLRKHRVILKQPKSRAILRLILHKLLELPSSTLPTLAAAEHGRWEVGPFCSSSATCSFSTWELKISSFYRYRVRLPRKWCCSSL